MTLYKIRDWDKLYETHETRKLVNLRWVPVQNNFDSLGLKRILKNKDAISIFAAWILLLEIASKCTPRGTLARDGIPLSPEDAGDITGFPGDMFKTAINVLSSKEIGWITGDSPAITGKSPAEGRKEGREGRKPEIKDCAETAVINQIPEYAKRINNV